MPSQVTPRELRMAPPSNTEPVIVPGGAPSRAPPGSENLSVRIDTIVVQGGDEALSEAARAWVLPRAGTRITVAEIFALAASLERLYADAGYFLARVVVPPQSLVDGAQLRLRVVDGFIEAVDLSQVPAAVRGIVAARTAALVGQRHLPMASVERQLLLAGDVPGLSLSSTLLPGQEEGGSRLVLAGGWRPATGFIGLDNRLDRSLGTWQLKGQWALHSALGVGEQIYAVASFADPGRAVSGTAPLQVFGAGAFVPLGNDGASLNPEFTRSVTRTPATDGAPASRGEFQRLALRASVAAQRSRRENLNASLVFEQVTQRLAAPDFGVDLSHDRYGVVRAGLDYGAASASGQALLAGAALSHGTGGRSQAEASASGVALSRQGAGPNFNKLAASMHLGQPLPGALHLGLIALGQSSLGQPLLRSEQFSLDGEEALSTVPAGSFSVDGGATLRAELGRPFALARATVFPFVLASAGRGQVLQPTVVEQRIVRAHAVGLGLRGSIDDNGGATAVKFDLQGARTSADSPGFARKWRWTLSATVPF
ncbi:MAG: ShlB/FhaC/HecB family hemolysin secretion/activation protein [Burkholderiales bacterium]